MNEKLSEYLKQLVGESLNALSGNTNGVVEISIGLKNARPQDNGSDAGYTIRHSKMILMLNHWELKSRSGEILASNCTSYPEVEKIFMKLRLNLIILVDVEDDLKKITIETEDFLVTTSREMGFEMLVHDFDHESTLVARDKGEAVITSKNKEFPF